MDIPGALEDEYEGNPVADVDFQVFLAQDLGAQNGFQHDVIVYGGVWWDYTYTASDIPEPLTMAGICMGVFALGRYFRRHRMAAK